jgi:hemerythrin-like domain-containing protein
MTKIIETLQHEHKTIVEVLDVLEREVVALARPRRSDRADYSLAWNIIDYFLNFPDMVHHPKEDIIFRHMQQADWRAAGTVGDLTGMHAELSSELQALAEALKRAMEKGEQRPGELTRRARAFIDHQRQHLKGEERLFFPLAEDVLKPEDWTAIERQFNARLDPLIGGETAEQYEAQYRHILDVDRAHLVPEAGTTQRA